jgi:hypothetical protein
MATWSNYGLSLNLQQIDNDCAALKSAMKGLGTDEDAIINILTQRNNEQRFMIRKRYEYLFKKDLIKELKSELHGNFEDAVIALLDSPFELDCKGLHHAMSIPGTDEEALIEILATRSPQDIEQIKLRYAEMYPGRNVISDIEGDTSGNFRKILVALLKANRPANSQSDMEECEKCAKLLHEATERKKVDADVFTKIFTEKSQADFIRIAQLYYKLTKKTILSVVEKEFSGDCKEALIGIIYAMLSPAEFFAKKVYKAVKGLGTDNNTLIRILITRDEKDMPQIKQFFKQLYKKDMIQAIKDDTSGNYQKILIELASH